MIGLHKLMMRASRPRAAPLSGTHILKLDDGRQTMLEDDEGNQVCMLQDSADSDSINLDHMAVVSTPGEIRPGQRPGILEPEPDRDSNIFFRISHVMLGRHKLFEKGAVATHDFGLEIIPVLKTDGDGIDTADTALLNFSACSGNTKLSTWMSETRVSASELRQYWKIWTPDPQGGQAAHLWNLERMDLHMQFSGCDTAHLKSILRSFIEARAYGDSYFAFVPDPSDSNMIDVLQRADVICRYQEGFKRLDLHLVLSQWH